MNFISAIIWLLVIQTSLHAQSPNSYKNDKAQETNPIIGTWRLIEYKDLDTLTGKWNYPYGKNPQGYFTYTKTNIVNLNISSDSHLKISEDSAKNFSIYYFDMADHNAFGYFGTYSIDAKKLIVTHHVKGGSIPWYIDTDQHRPFAIKGDTLFIGNPKTRRRVLVKAD